MEWLHQAGTRAVLLPLGVSLCFVGVVLRGFARSLRQTARLRHQQWLDERKPGETEPAGKSGWLERNISPIANATVVAGLAVTVVALFRA